MSQSVLFLLLFLMPTVNSFTAVCGAGCICEPTYITCRGATITEIPTAVTGAVLGNILNFYCSTCDIGTLKANSFAVYTSLKYISIQYSGVTEIEPNAFTDVASRLTYLDLSDNSLTMIRAFYFTGLTSVINLELQANSISELQIGSFDDLTALTTLLLSNNQITFLSDYLFAATSLAQLDITNNYLYQLTNMAFPTGIIFITLYFSNNNIARIHPNVSTIFTDAGRVLLNDNPIICDCYILHLKTAILTSPSTYGDSTSSATTCGYPAGLDGDKLSEATIFAGGCFDLCLNIDCDVSATCGIEDDWPTCSCDAGLTGNGFVCFDPCDGCLGVATCSYDSATMNGTCVCPVGFEIDNSGKNCTEINECLSDPCPINSTCLDQIGDFGCDCDAGYYLKLPPNLSCADVNECLNTSLYNCTANSECVNIHGSYTCDCVTGFVMNATGMCEDINECGNVSICHQYSTCSNQIGGFSCDCIEGFVENSPGICQDIDECLDATVCPSNSHCDNSIGSYVCGCNLGYEMSGVECIDINECLNVSLYNCQPDSTCQNVPSNYTCQCNVGFVEDSPGFCSDFDECSFNATICPDNSHCNNTIGSYICECDLGYEDNGMECVDIDECLDASLYDCQHNSSCQNRIGSYECQCDIGFVESSPNFCADIDECLNTTICRDNSHCNNTIGSYICECDLGYRDNGMECVDIDECDMSLFVCRLNSSCQNDIGSYTCVCDIGFVESSPNFCADFDECSFNATICPDNAHCNNTIGSYICECDLGYEDDGMECVDIDECLDASLYDCQHNSSCQNRIGSYECHCDIGFVESSPNFCADFDECSFNATICPDNAHCNNTIGSYVCECDLGYEDDGMECIDINECQNVSLFQCQPDSTCRNLFGSYTCDCDSGYLELAPNTCSDINECLPDPNPCPIHSHCNNTMGSYVCECNSGYEMISVECIDINECLNVSLYNCQSNSTCQNVPSNYTCQCNVGFVESSPNFCGDLDECLNATICPDNSHCNNTFGSYICECDLGYEDDGMECVDIDECLDTSLYDCQHNSSCQNNVGSYTCLCDTGFAEDSPNFCGDIDECLNTTICRDNSHCNNTFGSYICECDLGYQDNGVECVDIDECRDMSLFVCPLNSSCQNNVGNYTCVCDTGFVENSPGFCGDFDECSFNATICPDNAHCNNTFGSYICECDLGYEDDGMECVDIDECLDASLYDCQHNSSCQNRIGSYECQCDTGFAEDSPNFCADFNECLNATICTANAHCNNTFGSYICDCDFGYEDDGVKCVDIDECLDASLYDCQHNSSCQNNVGSYTCVCDIGFVGSSPGFCGDFDECSFNATICTANAHCNNTFGSYICECDLGYQENGMECTDIDECRDMSLFVCQLNSSCQNRIGSYECVCDIGFVEDSPNFCADINECLNATVCPDNSHCNNTFGSYICECDLGYEDNGMECIDINECNDPLLHMCPSRSNCFNLQGGYDCICDTGFEKIGSLCLDKNECSNGEATCHPHSTCANIVGSYNCVCDSGYEDVQSRCIDINECSIGTANCPLGENCTNLPGAFACVLCPSGFTFLNDTCEDVDECALFTDLCLDRGVESGTCLNNNGSFSCVCLDGFEPQNSECIDTNECLFLTSVCHSSAECHNIINGFNCTCPDPGYAYTDFTNGCQDIDECNLSSSCDVREYCINNIGSFGCECLSGYFRGILGSCEDDNECIAQSDLCDRLSTDCMNTIGSYYCECNSGYVSTADRFVCEDINECELSGYCGNTAVCVNSAGSHSCICSAGLELSALKECVDINECFSSSSCPSQSNCYNYFGGFDCVCNEGFYPTNIISVLFCSDTLETPFCVGSVQSGFDWPDTSSNTTSTIICPNNNEQFAKRLCNINGQWNVPDILNCVSMEISVLSDQLNSLSLISPNFTAVLGDISMQLTSYINSSDLLTSDYLGIIGMYQTMTLISEQYIHIQNSFIPTNVATELFEVASAIVNPAVLENIQLFDQTAVLTAVTDILAATDSLTRNLVYTLFSEGNETQIIIETDNILVDIQRIRTEEGYVVSFNSASGDTSIDIPFEAINSANFVAFDDSLKNASIENCNTAATFYNIKNIQRFLTINVVLNYTRFDSWYCEDVDELETPNQVVNNDHLSASIDSTKCHINTDNLENGIIVSFQHSDTTLINSQCVYTTNYTLSQTGEIQWETLTCQKLPMSNQTHTFCNCSHLTSFAILMSPDPYYSSGVGMSIFSYSSLCISIFFLFISLGLHFMKLSISEAVLFVHRNLIFSILFSQIIFVLGIERNEWQLPCLIIAAFLHYILLVSFVWMLLEAVNALILIKRPFIKQLWLKLFYATVAYISPLIIVSVTFGLSICDYGHYPFADGAVSQTATTNCWLPRRNGRYWAFIGPALVIIAINCVLLFAIIVIILRLQFNRKKMVAAAMKTSHTETLVKGLASAVKATVLMVPILGITWIFGVFALNSINVLVSQASQWLFLVFNCYQGVFIFIFFCVLNEEVREKFQLLLLQKIFRKRTNQEELKEIGFIPLLRGKESRTRSPIVDRKSSQLSTEKNFPTKPQSSIRLNLINVSGGTFGSEDREVLSNQYRY